jgi:hypothetical protein
VLALPRKATSGAAGRIACAPPRIGEHRSANRDGAAIGVPIPGPGAPSDAAAAMAGLAAISLRRPFDPVFRAARPEYRIGSAARCRADLTAEVFVIETGHFPVRR